MALSAQLGYIVPLISMFQLEKVKLIGESWQCYVLGIHTINHYNKWLFNLVFVGETLWHERYHESKQNQTRQKNTQLNKPKQPNTINTLIWSYSYDSRSGNEVALFGGNYAIRKTTKLSYHMTSPRNKRPQSRRNVPLKLHGRPPQRLRLSNAMVKKRKKQICAQKIQ